MTSERPQRRPWLQFRLRTLLIAVLLLSLPLSWFAVRMARGRRQRKAVDVIVCRGGFVRYDSGIGAGMRLKPKRMWLRGLLGDDFFDTVIMVHLGGSETSDADLEQLRRITTLQSLNLSITNVTDAGLVQLESMANLEELALARTHVTNTGLAHLRGLTNLRVLDFYGTQVTDVGLLELRGLTNLEKLDLSHTQVTDGGLKHLNAFSGLHVLDLSFTQVTDAGLVHLKDLTNLQYLHLNGTFVTLDGVDELLEALPDCEIDCQFLRTTHPPPWFPF